VAALRLDQDVVTVLRRLGLKGLGEIATLGRDAIQRRFLPGLNVTPRCEVNRGSLAKVGHLDGLRLVYLLTKGLKTVVPPSGCSIGYVHHDGGGFQFHQLGNQVIMKAVGNGPHIGRIIDREADHLVVL
ncbi:MAG TPA: hypothetical protein DCL95_11615, partial [Rhodospirillaceae bacterium]|nr:hypothetical protein [Rhodospirillaceae bacterium]